MNPSFADLLTDWLEEQKSDWRHKFKISWKARSGDGEASSETGFIVHPNSENMAETIWVTQSTVIIPMLNLQFRVADPEFFSQLTAAMKEMEQSFGQKDIVLDGNQLPESEWIITQSPSGN
jgi:hypothetical protein